MQDIDIYTFLGETFYLSFFGMTNSRRYWSEKSRIGLIADLSQKHFEFIKSSIHCVDNSAVIPMDKVAIIRPVIDQFNKICKMSDPDQHCSVDENTISYKGNKSKWDNITQKTKKMGLWTLYALQRQVGDYLCYRNIWRQSRKKLPSRVKCPNLAKLWSASVSYYQMEKTSKWLLTIGSLPCNFS